ncbi:hypothetical protein T484DRAFT_1840037 [Baffinella frigidus]|nr:hypothetical protein T484DRAFT_1840037 [Cryptophyta sp. CCMP2293]
MSVVGFPRWEHALHTALLTPPAGRFRNDIPDVPFEPKLLTHPDDPLNHLTQYKPTTPSGRTP